MGDWRAAAIAPEATVRDAIAKLNELGGQIVLVVEGERLIGTITDGDVRRGILRGVSVEARVLEVMNRAPKMLKRPRTRDEVFAEMKRLAVRHLPIVDAEGRLIGLEQVDDVPSERLPWRPNWVLIMAGGRGSRLAPLTERTPKPMLEVGRRPLLETIVDTLKSHRLRRLFLAVHYHADVVERHFGDGSDLGVEIRYVHEPEPRGTAGALGMIRDQVDAPVVIMNGDLLTKLNFDKLLEYHQKHGAAVTMSVREFSVQVPFGVVRTDEHLVSAIEEKPLQRFIVNAGIYVVEPRVIPEANDAYLDMPTFIDGLVARGERVAAFPVHEYWRDIGRLEDLALASHEYREVFE